MKVYYVRETRQTQSSIVVGYKMSSTRTDLSILREIADSCGPDEDGLLKQVTAAVDSLYDAERKQRIHEILRGLDDRRVYQLCFGRRRNERGVRVRQRGHS
jgi:hypothetical protein